MARSRIINPFHYAIPADEKQIDYEKARRSLLDFTTVTKPNYEVNWHHALICRTLDRFIHDPNFNRLIISIAPQRGKSELVSRRLPAYLFGLNPDLRIILASYAADLACRMNRDVQRIIDTETYRRIFPKTMLSGKNVRTTALGTYVRTSDMFEIVGHQGSFSSVGIEGSCTGKPADIFLIDDPVKDMAEALSETVRQSVWDWYTSVALTRLSKTGKVLITQTRWHQFDLTGKVLENAQQEDNDENWHVLSIPEFYEEDNAHPEDPRTEEGEVLWPDRYPKNKMNTTKITVGTRVWNALYQQRPVADGGNLVKRDWFRYYTALPEFDYIALSVDCAFKGDKKNDYVAMLAFGVKGANKYILPIVVHEKLSFPATLAALKSFASKYDNYREIVIEEKANGAAVISSVKDAMPSVIPYCPTESKEARFVAVSPQIEAGNVFLPDPLYFTEAKKWVEDFVQECISFPNSKNDDYVDCLSQMLIRIKEYKGTWEDKFRNYEQEQTEDSTALLVKDMFGWNT